MDSIGDLSGPAGDQTSLHALWRQVQALRALVGLLAVSIMIIACGVNVFFLKQIHNLRQDITKGREIIERYNAETRPVLLKVEGELRAFAETNAAFMPIYRKWIGTPEAVPAELSEE